MGLSLPIVLLATATGVNDPYPVDFALAARAQRLANRVDINKYVVVSVPPLWRELGFVQAKTNIRGRIIAITVSPILLEDMDEDGEDAMFAHELAHTLRPCGYYPYATAEDELECEHAADAQSARWVGKRTALRGLCQLLASSWSRRYCTDCSMLIARIKLLHERRDIE